MKVAEVCRLNPAVVESVRSIQEAAELMRSRGVKYLVVVDDLGRRTPMGIITDGDLVVEVMADKVSTEAVTVGDIMGPDLCTVSEDQEIEGALKLMREIGVHHLPVVNLEGHLTGALLASDVIDRLIDEKIINT